MRKIAIFILATSLLGSCNLFKKTSDNTTTSTTPAVNLDTIVKTAYKKPPLYRGSAPIINQLIHTKLDVRFNWQKQYLYGKATITLKPHFYPTHELHLDAKGFDIHKVALVKGDSMQDLKYSYNKKVLDIQLDKQYTRFDTFKVFIDYTAKPNELPHGGSAAITDDKGLYFINPLGKQKDKPKEIWTQGETQSNSCWFPTIDRPDQRMTDEIYITVNKKYKTLSNGELVFSTDNKDGTRTDYWKMDKTFPPYLTMMAIGNFIIVKDHWKNIPVDFYMEPKYAPYAYDIFGHTPAMIDYFSKILHYPYAWNKYDQVIVRDYVSGAMENVTATLHGEFMLKTRRELLDNNLSNEDVVSHELFHHWFGDLVTCESWSNIPLNESFATYGEYLWREHEYGRDAADRLLQQDLQQYLGNVRDQKDLIRFHYHNREDMFDLISYQKGGCVLHMLRKMVGDSAFFQSLHEYLKDNQFEPVEIHQLRLAFEKVTGKDMNWFFNEWFLNKGYPILKFNYAYNDSTKKETLTVEQKQDLKQNPLYRLPIDVDVYYNGKKDRHHIVIDDVKQQFTFDAPVKPDLVNVDAQKMLLCEKIDHKPIKEWVFQYNHAPLYLDRYEALNHLASHLDNATAQATMFKALKDRYWYLRNLAIRHLKDDTSAAFRKQLIVMANSDSSSTVRSHAIATLSQNFKGDDLLTLYKKGLQDSSYRVEGTCLKSIAKVNPDMAMKEAKQFEDVEYGGLNIAVAKIYSDFGSDENNAFFIKTADHVHGFSQIAFVNVYADFLKKCKDKSIDDGLPVIENIAIHGSNKYVKFYGKKALEDLLDMYSEREQSTSQKIKNLQTKDKPNEAEITLLQNKQAGIQNQEKKIRDILDKVKAANNM